ncbi:MAG: GLPGLI family protein [Flavobacterium sp.]|nr:GLPGLI family protein [Flavobacterium sp.]
MKKYLLLAVFVNVGIASFAQEFQGMAVYESKTSTSELMGQVKIDGMTPDMQKMVEERMRKMFEKTFILNFDKTASIYKEEEKLDAPGQENQGRRFMSSMMGGGGTYYKNVKDKMFTVDREFMGKEFLVKDSLPKMEWKMEGESRQIGGYTCYKATAVKPVSKSDIRNLRPKKKDEKATETEKPAATSTNFMDQFEMPEEVLITAWYAPEIPVSQGPEGYYGLPGLILEVNDGKTVILCSKVVLNPKEKANIKAPTKGKVVTQAEYDKIMVEKMQEMQQMNSGPGGTTIRIGG